MKTVLPKKAQVLHETACNNDCLSIGDVLVLGLDLESGPAKKRLDTSKKEKADK